MAQALRKRPSTGSSAAVGTSERAPPKATGVAVDVDEKKRRRIGKEVLPTPLEKPDAGRSSQLGRKVESPATGKTAGPSGQQRGKTQEQKGHTNK